MPPTLYLIDGHALAYRTYYAITLASGDRFMTSTGEPTAGVYGFANVLMRLLEKEKPEYLAVAFDTGKTFRDQLFSEYKATRAKMPDDLRTQMERIRQLVDAFGFPRLEAEGFEADDVLGTIATQAVAEGFGVKILTGDRDLLQLVTPRIIVNLAGSKLSEAKDYTNDADVATSLGVRADQVVDYKALVGDHSDNIPGVPGIGEKTAVSLFQTYATLDEIYAHLADLPTRVRTKLEAGRASADMSRDLARIRTNVNITLKLEDARTHHINFGALDELFTQLEFKTLMSRLTELRKKLDPSYVESAAPTAPAERPLPGGVPGQQLSLFGGASGGDFSAVPPILGQAPYQLNTVIVDSPEALQNLVEKVSAAAEIALDTETTSTDPMRAELVGISLAVEEGQGFYIPVGHHTQENQLALSQIQTALRPILLAPEKKIIGHNLKYDLLVLLRHGLGALPASFDTMIAQWVMDAGTHILGLKDMAAHYLGIQMTHIEELIGKGKNQRSMADVAIATAASYAAADAEVTLRLKHFLAPELQRLKVEGLFETLEMPLVNVLTQMELEGISLDGALFQKMSAELSQRLGEIETQIYQMAGFQFNINSTQQLSKVLFESLRLSPPDRGKRTASGHFSTSAEVLEELRGKHPVVDLVLEYRELAKLKSTYVEALPQQVNPHTGRVHTSFNQTGAVTGRLASSDPNLQNIPTRTEIGRRVRQGFIAPAGSYLLSVDYSQIELRIVAHMSKDQAMLNAFHAGLDIHAATAAAILRVPLEQVTKDQRRRAKAINFGLIYGMSAFGLSRSTDLTLAEAENFVRSYFEQFPGVKQYLDMVRRQASELGYVETLLGRKRYFPNLRGQTNVNLRQREEREAINAPIQGTAADIMKIAMIRLPAVLQKARSQARLLLQVHDELVLEVPAPELLDAAAMVKEVMENAYPLDIPLLTEERWGVNWGEMQPISAFPSKG